MTTIYIIGPLLLLTVVLAAVWLERFSVPIILVALGLGLVAGSDVLGLWYFDNAAFASEVANAALVFILFQGGLSTKRSVLKEVALPAGSLATVGVLLTAAVTFGALHLVLGWSWELALLLATVISSTDAAATFSILRRQALPSRLASTVEIESAANDPMAILLTLVVVESLASGTSLSWTIVPVFAWKFVAGPLLGRLMASVALGIFNRLDPQDRGYYYVLLISLIPLTYGLAELAQASGMLAVFTAGLVMGNRHFIYQTGVRNFSAALSMIANVGVFVMMGLLVFPSQWRDLWAKGILLFLVLTFVARPVSVWIGTLGMGFSTRERLFMCWAGLRGAVPIVLATYPSAAGLSIGQDVFNLVFFAVVLSVALQGSTLGGLARRFGLATPARPPPRYGLELVTMAHSDLDLVVVDLPGPQGRPGPRIRNLTLPPGAILTLVSRGNTVVAPTGDTRLLGWDQVTVLARPSDEREIRAALLDPFDVPVDPGEAARVIATDPVEPLPLDPEARSRDHVVLIGHGSVGGLLAGFLRRRGLPFVVIEKDETAAMKLRAQGVPVLHGSGEEPELLERAGVKDANLLLVTTTQPVSARRAIESAQHLNPRLEIIVRVQNKLLAEPLSALPRTRCVQSDIELAYAMARLMLQATGVSTIETEALILDARRGENESVVAPARVLEVRVPPESPVVGRRLADLGLPQGSLVMAISREGEFVVPRGQTELRAGDALLLITDTESARMIERQLEAPREPVTPG